MESAEGKRYSLKPWLAGCATAAVTSSKAKEKVRTLLATLVVNWGVQSKEYHVKTALEKVREGIYGGRLHAGAVK